MSGRVYGFGVLAQGLMTYFVGLHQTDDGVVPSGAIETVLLDGCQYDGEDLRDAPWIGDWYFTRRADGLLDQPSCSWASDAHFSVAEMVTEIIEQFESERTVH